MSAVKAAQFRVDEADKAVGHCVDRIEWLSGLLKREVAEMERLISVSADAQRELAEAQAAQAAE